jgi:hypothetical protein
MGIIKAKETRFSRADKVFIRMLYPKNRLYGGINLCSKRIKSFISNCIFQKNGAS